ncbi:hypothetical protein Dimus_013581 [Dionaea muscipula]
MDFGYSWFPAVIKLLIDFRGSPAAGLDPWVAEPSQEANSCSNRGSKLLHHRCTTPPSAKPSTPATILRSPAAVGLH